VKIGKLGDFFLKKGIYVYSGNANRNLKNRVLRHFIPDKNKFWHIDYLTTHEIILWKDILIFPQNEIDECFLVKLIRDFAHPFKNFGSSDCKSGCGSHLHYLKKIENYVNYIRLLKDKSIEYLRLL